MMRLVLLRIYRKASYITDHLRIQSAISGQVEDAVKVLARNHSTVRFVKLHFLDAEMDEIAAPGILAYRAGDCFANLVSIIDEIPSGKDISSSTLEGVLQSCVALIL